MTIQENQGKQTCLTSMFAVVEHQRFALRVKVAYSQVQVDTPAYVVTTAADELYSFVSSADDQREQPLAGLDLHPPVDKKNLEPIS